MSAPSRLIHIPRVLRCTDLNCLTHDWLDLHLSQNTHKHGLKAVWENSPPDCVACTFWPLHYFHVCFSCINTACLFYPFDFVLETQMTHTNVSGLIRLCSSSLVLVLLAGLYRWYQMADLLHAALMAWFQLLNALVKVLNKTRLAMAYTWLNPVGIIMTFPAVSDWCALSLKVWGSVIGAVSIIVQALDITLFLQHCLN